VLAVELQNADALADVFGHKGLDRIISATGQRMRDHLRSMDIMARAHTRGLSALMPGAGLEQAQEMADAFSEKLSEPIPVAGLDAEAEIRIGIAVFPGHGDKAQDLLRRASLASRIKTSEGHARVFHREIETHSRERLVLAAELRNAIEANQLCLFYQPKVRLADNQVIGSEALVRWRHPEKGLVPPVQFIPAAEETGLITPLTEWVIESAIRQAYQWKQVGLTQRVAVNVSARGFHDLALPQRLRRSLATWGLSAEFLGLELTESTLMEDVERAMRVLTELRELGIEVAVDDFGTGYSSLRYLQRFPTSEVKLDYSFVRAATVEKDALRIVQSVVRLTHDLERKITAEGVENETLVALVRELGCDSAQGYFFAEPMPPDEWVEWLANWQSQRAA
jgi:diguanylate cyclase (GGDEF)-like protein